MPSKLHFLGNIFAVGSGHRKIFVQTFDLGFGNIRILYIENTADTATAAGIELNKLQFCKLLIFQVFQNTNDILNAIGGQIAVCDHAAGLTAAAAPANADSAGNRQIHGMLFGNLHMWQ